MQPEVLLALALLVAVTMADDSWSVLKSFDFSSMDAVRREWDIAFRKPGDVNNELEAYTDSANNLFTRNKTLVMKAQRNRNGCAFYPNMDIKGQDIQAIYAPTASSCCSLCRNFGSCKAFSHYRGACYLKSGSDNLITSTKSGLTAGICADVTSARLHSKQLFSPVNSPGRKIRVEFTAKVPTAKGGWPALWVLGQEGTYGRWPQEGEVDVMEWVYQVGDKTLASLHWKGPSDWSTAFPLSRQQMSNNWNTYGVELSAVALQEYVQYYVTPQGGKKIMGKRAVPSDWTSSWVPSGAAQGQCANKAPGGQRCSPLAPFDNQMTLILNYAVGGDWGGCCGVNGDYSAFDGAGVEFPVRSVVVSQNAAPPSPPPNPAGQPENWQLLKSFDFTSMEAVRRDWVVEKWPAAAFNHEHQAYVDSPDTLFVDAKGTLNLKAQKSFQCGANIANTDVNGDNIKVVSGAPMNMCCEHCQQTQGCQAWSWNSYLGGTCWLKASTSLRGGANGVTANVMAETRSARIHSNAHFSPVTNATGRKIRVEAQAMVPTVPGAWPAIWLLGATPQYGNWPQEGEIDILEWVWSIQNQVYASLHWKGSDDYHSTFKLPMSSLATNFYTFGVEYSAQAHNEYLQYFVILPSGATSWGPRVAASTWTSSWKPSPPCAALTPGADKCSPLAPYDNQMMVILNLAVGGDWGGIDVGDYAPFEQGVALKVRSLKVFHN